MAHRFPLIRTPWKVGWGALLLLVATPLLTGLFFADAWALLVYDSPEVGIATTVVGSAATLCCWYHLCSIELPWLLLDYRVRAAYRRADWSVLRSLLGAAEERGWMSGEWHATLGLANFHLERFDEAIASHERVEGRLADPELEYARIYNHSRCLVELGRNFEARLIFESVPEEEWPDPMTGHVRWLSAYFEHDPSPRETVQ